MNSLPQNGEARPRCANERFTLMNAQDIEALPETQWLIDEILPAGSFASVYGQSGVGKSFLCLGMAAAIATGEKWFGHETERCDVIYLALEGRGGLHRRIRAWEKHCGVDFPENVRFVYQPFSLMTSEDSASLAELINNCSQAGLIIVDTLNRAAPGADENGSVAMGAIVANAEALQLKTGATVLAIHHSGKEASRGLRGHSSLHAALDSVIEITRSGDRLHWNLVKSKDGECGIGRAFGLRQIEIETHQSRKPISSCVIVEVEGTEISNKGGESLGIHQKAIMEAFAKRVREMREVAAHTGDEFPNGIPFDQAVDELKIALPKVDPKHRKQRTKEALIALARMGYLVASDNFLSLPAAT